MPEKIEIFIAWKKTVIVSLNGSICGACGQKANPGEGLHESIPLSKLIFLSPISGCEAEWEYAATTNPGMVERWRMQMPQFTWIGVALGEYPNFVLKQSWL